MRSKSSARTTTNLRPHPPGFVGRQEDLRRMHERFETGERLVSLVGSGGMGKTRLATHYGNQRLNDCDGVWFADLTEAANLDAVCAAVARVFGVPLPGEGTTEQNLATTGEGVAARGRVLLILDNCEHVADAASAALEGWFSLAPEAFFLVTSRERLRLANEVAIHIGPLQRDEAVELFVERARRIADDFQPGEGDLATIGKIVEQLDRMPLAIELAASRTSVLAPQGLLELLAKRHEPLRATIDWSWNLLDDWEPDALAQLSVFRGGFTLAAAEAVLDLSGHEAAPSALGVIQSLLDKSLLHANQEGRFGQHLSVREYAAERLAESGQAERVGKRHAIHRGHIDLAMARRAVSLLERATEHEQPAGTQLPADALVIGPEARWFCPPGGDPVDLFRRKPLRRLLQRLAEQHTTGADRGLTVDELLAAGWPGERVSREAGANRVRVALATLRKLGLKSYIHSRPDGYRLTPELALRDDARPSPPGE